MENWRRVFREGIAPHLPTAGLEALAKALEEDDPRLLQGATTSPPPLQCVTDWPVEAADAIAFCGWKGNELKTVGDVEEFFARVCFDTDQLMGEPAACRWFLNFWDNSPRDIARRELLAEVRRKLAMRAQPAAQPAR